MRNVNGEQYAQVERADPCAPAVWRSPVHRTPEWIIWLVQLLKLLYRVIRPGAGGAGGGVTGGAGARS